MFNCDYPKCEKSYTNKENLKEHVLSHHKNKRFTCEYQDCKKSFGGKKHLAVHVRSYHKKERWLCKLPNCEASFTVPSDLYRHIRADHKQIRHTCARCNAEFKSKYELDLHSKKKKKCQPGFSRKEKDKIVFVEAHLADIDSQIETVAALISGLDSVECEDCFLKK